jgi:succinyldiaminopimelate transaminase
MINPRLETDLNDYPFARLNALIADLPAPAQPIIMSVGEPQGPVPQFARDVVSRDLALANKYPPNQGTPDLCAAIVAWLQRRYGIADGILDPARHVLPLAGSKEGVYAIGTVAVPPSKNGAQPVVMIPNPFYQVYLGAAVLSGGAPMFMNAHAGNGFLPDFDSVPADVWRRTSLVYLCSPGNPQGAMAKLPYLQKLIDQCRRHDAVLAIDECYAEIYNDAAPAGGLQAALAMDETAGRNPFASVVVFHSLSKRSNAAGLRSGFVAGDPRIVAMMLRWKTYGGMQIPLPIQNASAALWRDEAHVETIRGQYQTKFRLAKSILHNKGGYFTPDGGFFLWLDVGDGEKATRRLWAEGGIKVLPGGYLARETDSVNPGDRYIRVALVQDIETTRTALTRIAELL